jgi:hypothetical protein
MILESQNWSYDPKGFEEYFLPISGTCSQASLQNEIDWNGIDLSLI